jgi:hypothetical protein
MVRCANTELGSGGGSVGIDFEGTLFILHKHPGDFEGGVIFIFLFGVFSSARFLPGVLLRVSLGSRDDGAQNVDISTWGTGVDESTICSVPGF